MTCQVWRLRLWDDAAVQAEVLGAGRISLGGDEVSDMSIRPSDDEIVEMFRNSHPEWKKRGLPVRLSYWRIFLDKMTLGDLVLVPLVDSKVSILRITGGYQYQPAAASTFLRHVRPVEVLVDELPKGRLPSDYLIKQAGAPGTLRGVEPDGGCSGLLRFIDELRAP